MWWMKEATKDNREIVGNSDQLSYKTTTSHMTNNFPM